MTAREFAGEFFPEVQLEKVLVAIDRFLEAPQYRYFEFPDYNLPDDVDMQALLDAAEDRLR